MELGELVTYFVQYTLDGRWITKPLAYSSLDGAFQMCDTIRDSMPGATTRVIVQTTTNQVLMTNG